MIRATVNLTCGLLAAFCLTGRGADESPLVLSSDARYGRRSYDVPAFAFDAVRSSAFLDLDYTAKGEVGAHFVWTVADASGKVLKRLPSSHPLHVPVDAGFGKRQRHFVATPRKFLDVPGAAKVALRLSAYDLGRKTLTSNDVLVVHSVRAGWQDGPVSDAFANWFALGDEVVFRARTDGRMLRGAVTDTDGREVFRAEAAEGVWRWRPKDVGFYTVKFTRVAADGSETKVSAELGCANYAYQDGRVRLIESAAFPRDEQKIAVSPRPPRSPQDVPRKFGYNVLLSSSPIRDPQDFKGNVNEQLDCVRLLGMGGHLRLHVFRWAEIEAAGRGQYDWRKPDLTFEALKEHGYGFDRFMVNTWGTPRWAARLPADADKYEPYRLGGFCPKDMSDWGNYVEAFVRRYPEMEYFEIWDEPHLPGQSVFWMEASPEEFVELLKTGYRRAKAVNPSLSVNMGGIGMRYAAFYRAFVKAGGVDWYDTMGTHCGYDMRAMRAIEREQGVAHKPYREDEWHTVLYNASNRNPPSEGECAFRMLVNFADLLHVDRQFVAGFGLDCGDHTPESAAFVAKTGGIQQIAGLFRSQPWAEPRFAAFALRTAADLFTGEVKAGGAWRFGEDGRQCAVLQRHDGGTVAFVFSNNPRMKAGAVAPEILAAAKGRRTLGWEGRTVDLRTMKPRRMYYIIDPDERELKKGTPVEVLDYSLYNFKAKRDFVRGGYAPDGSVSVKFDGESSFALRPSSHGLDFAFALPGTDEIPSVRVAIDCVGKGYLEDVVEFAVGKDGKIVKPRSPEINGDIPAEYSFAGTVLTRTTVSWTRGERSLCGHLRIAAADLYPFIYDVGRTIRLSLTMSGTKTRSWGGGLGAFTDAAAFGGLSPSGGGRVLAASLERNGDGRYAAHFKDLVPGSRLRYRARLKSRTADGTPIRLCVAAWTRADAKDRYVQHNFPNQTATAEGIVAEGTVDVPANAHEGFFQIFFWPDNRSDWEATDFCLFDE